jgi:hypothetical protein
VFQGFAAVLDEGDAALASAGEFLRAHLASRINGLGQARETRASCSTSSTRRSGNANRRAWS